MDNHNLPPILGLPLEVRLLIYDYAFECDKVYVATIRTGKRTEPEDNIIVSGGWRTVHTALPRLQQRDIHTFQGYGALFRTEPSESATRAWFGAFCQRILHTRGPRSSQTADAGHPHKLTQQQSSEARPPISDFDIRLVRGPLALLLTCSAIYAEALPVLYSRTRFNPIDSSQSTGQDASLASASSFRVPTFPSRHLSHLTHLALPLQEKLLAKSAEFLAVAPPPCLAHIQTLVLHCCGNPGMQARTHIPQGKAWKDLWREIGQLKALRELWVGVCGDRVPAGWCREVLGPMIDAGELGLLASLTTWKVYVTWSQFRVDEEIAKGLPFELLITSYPGHGYGMWHGPHPYPTG